MQAGKLRHRITIERPVKTRDASGSVSTTWEKFSSTRCGFETASGNESQFADRTQARQQNTLVMRFIGGVTPQMRIRLGCRVLNITSIVNVNEHCRELRIGYTEVTDG